MKKRNRFLKMTLSALFLALAYVLPFLTGQIPELGAMLCPMHIPVLICGFICGPVWGCAVGVAAPLFRSLTLGMPPLFPKAVCMAVELAAYGAVSGLAHRFFPHKKPFIYCSLLTAMITGRLVWGASMFICVVARGGSFTLASFLAGAVLNSVPGIIVQIIFIPALVMMLESKKITASTSRVGDT